VHSFVLGDTLSLSHNPPIVNNPKYDTKRNKNHPVFINGLRIAVIEDDNGKYKIEVKFDNNVVHKDTRVSGNVVLKPIENVDIDFDVKEGVGILVNKSGTINTLVMQKDSSFINPTQFVIDSAVIRLRDVSQLVVQDSSIILFKNHAKLIMNEAELKVLDKAGLYIDATSVVELDKKIKVTCSKDGVIHLQKGAIVNGMVLKQDFVLPKDDTCSGSQLMNKLKKMNK